MPGGSELAEEAIGQEHKARQVLEAGRAAGLGRRFRELLREFIAAAREHVAFEETKVWPGLREALTAQEVGELGDSLMKAKEHTPTGRGTS